jgi:hypothetical protein
MWRRLCVLAFLTCLVLPAAASADTDYSACSTAEGNRLAGPHPFLKGHLRDEGSPGYTPFEADAYMNDDETWLCLRVGDVGQRIVVPAASPVTPPTGPVWALLDDPPVSPSGQCPSGRSPFAWADGGIPPLGIHRRIEVYADDSGAAVCFALTGPFINVERQGIGVDVRDP